MTRADSAGPPIILMYHQVAERGEDPWGLAVTPARFAEQIEALARHRHIVPLSELATRLGAGRPTNGLAVITFDDGYADNLTAAKPVLARFAAPATVFVVASAIGAAGEFWWDELGRILLEPGSLPEALCAEVGGVEHQWRLGAARDYSPAQAAAHRTWRAWHEPPSERQAAYVGLWHMLRRQTPDERGRVLEQLRQAAGIGAGARPDRRALTRDELAALSEDGLVEIGGHTLTHASLPEQTPEDRAGEIRAGKHVLEDVLGQVVSAFAYPFGDHDDASVSAVRDAGFVCAVTTIRKPVGPQRDPFRLPRIGVEDCDVELFERCIR